MDPINPFENQINTLNPNIAPSPARTSKTALLALLLILVGVGAFAYRYLSNDMDAGAPTSESQIASPDQQTATSSESDAALEAELNTVLEYDSSADMSQVEREFAQ